MKSCEQYYTYKKFIICFSKISQCWLLEPIFINDIDFQTDYRDNYSEEFKTIKHAKEYIKDNEQELKQNIYI